MGDVPGENLWSDSATGILGALGNHVVRIASHVNGLYPGRVTLLVGRNSHLYLIQSYTVYLINFVISAAVNTDVKVRGLGRNSSY